MTYGEAANSTIKGLAAQPGLLLIAVLNIVMLVGVGYVAKSQADERRMVHDQQDSIVKFLIEKCGHAAQ
jgi:hypothetical protein